MCIYGGSEYVSRVGLQSGSSELSSKFKIELSRVGLQSGHSGMARVCTLFERGDQSGHSGRCFRVGLQSRSSE